ncbi:MAG: 1-hydroxy-2-methyl-2-(E)-butenyl 4-diphosphate synthase, partial [Bacteroidetes bacterium 4572_77]
MNSPKKAAISIGKMISSPVEHVLVQTMTSTATLDTLATLAQIIRAEKAGAQLIRISARNVQEATHLAIIKKELHKQGCFIPLIADIHFNPKAAEVAAKIVEKVRINPGNYVDRNTGKTHWTKAENDLELQRIKARLAPLVEICKTHNTAIRVGVNYGSLS